MYKQTNGYIIFFTLLMLLISGCGTELKYPSINQSESNEYNYGAVVWRDLVTPNPQKAAEFYKSVFGWTVSKVGSEDKEYWIFKNNGKPVAGMFLMSEAKKNAGGEWLPYFSVKSVDETTAFAKSKGASIPIKPIEMNGRGKVALLTDPQRAYFALIHSASGDPVNSMKNQNEFIWSELWSNNMDSAIKFYQSVFNSEVNEIKDDKRIYSVLSNNNQKSAGIMEIAVENVRDHWLQYIRVSDVEAVQKKAEDSGAKILISRDSTIRKGSVSVIIDPTGAPFAIQKWPIE